MHKSIAINDELNIITNRETAEQIERILDEYLCKIEHMQNDMGIEDILGAVYVYAELYEHLVDKEKWDHIIKAQLVKIKECVEEYRLPNGMALFGGLCDAALAVYLYSKKTGHYIQFWRSIHELILEFTGKMVEEYTGNLSKLLTCHYDCVRGLSGILNYFVHADTGSDDNNAMIEALLGYLIRITEKKSVNGKIVPGWHIERENQLRENERLKFINGSFDFGTAHGIAGPLAAMSIAYRKGYRVEGQKEAILCIAEEYERLALRYRDCTFWKGQYSFEDYVQDTQEPSIYKNKMGWCYGPIGAVRALKLAGEALGCRKLIEREQENMSEIASMQSKDYLLNSPIICHGWAGLMALLTLEYKENADRLLQEKINELAENIVKDYHPDDAFGFRHREPFYQNGQMLTEEIKSNEFLSGASGIVLSLISLIKADTSWEIHLLAK